MTRDILSGVISFADDSTLYFKEFVDSIEDSVDKLMYGYHYQDSEKQLVFRYDNARHKPRLPFEEHKHLREQIVETSAPTLADVLEEIFTENGWR